MTQNEPEPKIPDDFTMGDALVDTYRNSVKSERQIRGAAQRLNRISARLDRLFSVRGVGTIVGIVVVGNLLAGLVTVAAVRLLELATRNADASGALILGVAGSLMAAGLLALGRYLFKNLGALVRGPNDDA